MESRRKAHQAAWDPNDNRGKEEMFKVDQAEVRLISARSLLLTFNHHGRQGHGM